MDRDKAITIANFRYSLVAPIVSQLEMKPGQQQQLIEEATRKTYQIPFSSKTQVSQRTMERYLQLYRQGGYDALIPKYLRSVSAPLRIPQEYLDKAAKLKEQQPKRAIPQIIAALEMADEVPKGILKRSTVYEYFCKKGLDRKTTQAGSKAFQRFTPKHRNERWQGDVCHLMYLPDPQRSNKRRKVYLIAWLDEYSRVITHAQCYFEERLFTLEDSFKKAILKWSLPSQIYVDNGSPYSSKHLMAICGRLGIGISHTRPYKPQGRGKVERLFRTVQSSFLPDLEVLLKEKSLSLADVNEYLQLWITHHYHQRIHSSLKQKPIVLFQSDTKPLRTADLAILEHAFLMEDTRKADKTAMFSLDNVLFQAPLVLAGQRVTVRYNPYDLSRVQLYCGNQRFDDAYPAEIPEHVQFESSPAESHSMEEPPMVISYLKGLERQARVVDPLSYVPRPLEEH